MASALDSSSPEYATLKEMFSTLVKNLAANAAVIAPLNNELLSSGLISKEVFITVQNPGSRATPYHICNDMLTPVLEKVESNPDCFYSLIKSLKDVGLNDIVEKLKDELQSRKKAYEEQQKKQNESANTAEEADPPSFPLVSIPPDLSYTTIGKITEGLKNLRIDVAATILLDLNLSSLFAPSSSQPHLQKFCEQIFNYVKYHRRGYSPKVDEEPEESEEKPRDLSPEDISRVFEVGFYPLAVLALLEAETETLKAAVSSEQHKANLLHHASKHGWINVIDALIKKHGFDPASVDTINQAAVHYAAKHAEYEAFKFLVANHNCDPMCKNSEGETPLLFAIEAGSIEIVKYCMTLPLGCDGNTLYNGKSLGIIAAEHGHIYMLKYLIKECYFNVKNSSPEGNCALDLAARSGHLDIVKYLISECECDPNKKKKLRGDPKKPLHHASEKGHIDVVKYLISDCKCDVHEGHGARGSTPLQYATKNQHLELVKYFVLECNCDAEPALQYAAEQGDMDMLKFLGKNCNKNSKYDICLDVAIKEKHPLVVKYLVNQWGKKEDLFKKLYAAIRSRSYFNVDFLITDCKVDPTTIDSQGRSLLHYAAEDIFSAGGLRVVQCLLAAGLDPQIKDDKGDTPITIAGSRSTNKRVIKIFFEAFAKTKTMYPVDSYVNVLIVGNSGAGKSTLSKVIEKTGSLFPNLARWVDENEVKPLTAGIIPINLKKHSQLQNIVLYDFAGQSQYYLSHTAVIENILQGAAAVIIIVVDVSNSDYLIHLKQWLAVVREQMRKAKDDCKLIVVASHVDLLNFEDEKEKIREIKKELPKNDNVIIHLDCRRLYGDNLTVLLRQLKSACSYIRDNNKKSLTLYCHMMYKLLQESKKDILTLKDIAHDAATKNDQFFLPTHNGKEILNILSSLHATGLIYFLNCEGKDAEVWTHDHDDTYIKVADCRIWVIKNKQVLLQHVDGVLFSPEESKIPNNGIITVSKLEKEFPEYDSLMLISFLESMGLCHMVSPFFLIQTNLVEKGQDIHLKDVLCLFFPSSVTIERPIRLIPHEFIFGWYLQCTNLHDLFPQRFFNSLLLHFTMKYPVEEACKIGHDKYQCSFWKNGLKWSDKNGITTLLELVDENQCVLVLMSCNKGAQESNMVSLRRRLIHDIFDMHGKFCGSLDTVAFVIDRDDLKYPIDKPKTRVAYCVANFIKLGKDDFINPTVQTKDAPSKGKQVCDVLPYESDYANLSIFGGAEPNDKAGDGGNFRYPGREKKRELNIRDLNYVIDTLRQNDFPDRNWKSLGSQLGLDDSTLDDIDEEYGTLRERFEKCLHTWLKKEDSTKQQDKSWATLAEALRKIGQREVAKKIKKENQLNY